MYGGENHLQALRGKMCECKFESVLFVQFWSCLVFLFTFGLQFMHKVSKEQIFDFMFLWPKNSSMELAVIWGNSDFPHSDFAHSDFAHSDFAHSDFSHFFVKNFYFFNIHYLETHSVHVQMEKNLTKWNLYTLFHNNIHIQPKELPNIHFQTFY